MFTSIKILLIICACANVFLLTSVNAKKPKTPGKDAEMCVSTSANTLNATADGDVCVKVLGQSGKIDFTFDTTTVQLTMDSIQEVDSSGNVVENTLRSIRSTLLLPRRSLSVICTVPLIMAFLHLQ